MIRHIVAWNYKDELTSEEKQINGDKIKTELENLKTLISEIIQIKVILNPAKSSNRDVVLMSIFENEKDLANYQIHPEHKKVSQFISSIMKDRVCLDLFEC